MIEVRQLSKTFGALVAVDDLSFTVARGEVLGFLGPNGAGKSTTMKMLTGYLLPTSGYMSVNGYDVVQQGAAVRSIIGYLPEGAPSYGDMSVYGFLSFIADVRGLRGAAKRDAIARVVASIELADVLTQKIDTLSKGFRRRVGLAQAILHDPQVLILDEPTDGLDPNQKHHVRQLIRNLSSEKIVIVSTHILEEVSAVCSRALIISHGKRVADDTPHALAAQSRYHGAVTFRVENRQFDPDLLRQLPGVASVELDQAASTVTVFPKDGCELQPVISRFLEQQQCVVAELYVERGRLDDVFRTLTGGVL